MLDPIEIVGIAGAIILIVAWIPELQEIIKAKRSKLDKRFSELLLAATLVLLVYSILKNDTVFIIINIFLFFEISISVYYSLWPGKRRN